MCRNMYKFSGNQKYLLFFSKIDQNLLIINFIEVIYLLEIINKYV